MTPTQTKGNAHSTVTRQLDAALGESPATAARQSAHKLEAAIETFQALTTSSSSSSSGGALRPSQQRQQQADWQQQQEEWVQSWARLLACARVTLATPLLEAGISGSGSGSSGAAAPAAAAAAAATTADSDSDDEELEGELAALRGSQAAAEARRQAEVAAAQQLVAELWQQKQQQQQQLERAEAPAEGAAGSARKTADAQVCVRAPARLLSGVGQC
jgi:hypothetical protein